MTVKELKSQLTSADDEAEVAIQTPTGHQEITKASKQGDYFTFWADDSPS